VKKKSKKSTVAIVGPGRLGRVLALALNAAGYCVTELIHRDSAKSRIQARSLATLIGAQLTTVKSAKLDADIVWLCVPDDALSATAQELATRGFKSTSWQSKIVLHSSGALPAAELAPLKKLGAAVGSAHPMNTFVASSKPSFAGTPFAVEGDVAAVRVAGKIIRELNSNADVFKISGKQKPLYHAVGSLSSPLMISLLSAAESVARKAGIPRPGALTQRILQQTLENYLSQGANAAFSGPIRRGDVATVNKHLLALRALPEAREIYVTLAKHAVSKLPAKRQKELKEILKK
jgi:predicted short-subunit dehydrogenase-like oxidoreductase (DUF2520 family)